MRLARIETFAVQVPRDATLPAEGPALPLRCKSSRGRYALAANLWNGLLARYRDPDRKAHDDRWSWWAGGRRRRRLRRKSCRRSFTFSSRPLCSPRESLRLQPSAKMLYDAMRVRGHLAASILMPSAQSISHFGIYRRK